MNIEPKEEYASSADKTGGSVFLRARRRGAASAGLTGAAQKDRDTAIFNRFLAGEDEAYKELYDLYERPLYLYILRLLNSEADAEDVFQDVWVRVYRLRGEKTVVTKFSGLLFTVARNLSINALRDRKVMPDSSIDDAS